MGNRLAQFLLLILALAFAFAALAVFNEPWRTLNEAFVVDTVCAHLLAAVLALACYRAALHFGIKAAYGSGKRLRGPKL